MTQRLRSLSVEKQKEKEALKELRKVEIPIALKNQVEIVNLKNQIEIIAPPLKNPFEQPMTFQAELPVTFQNSGKVTHANSPLFSA